MKAVHIRPSAPKITSLEISPLLQDHFFSKRLPKLETDFTIHRKFPKYHIAKDRYSFAQQTEISPKHAKHQQQKVVQEIPHISAQFCTSVFGQKVRTT